MYLTAAGIALQTSRATTNWATTRIGAHAVVGTTGNDIFYAAAGDAMTGGAGDDEYDIWSTNFSIVEKAGGGTDTVVSYAWGSTILPDNVENLTLAGVASTGGVGNALDNIIMAGSTGACLDGGAGSDVLVGGSGADMFEIKSGNGSDAIEQFTHGSDIVRLDGYGITSFDELMRDAKQDGKDVRFTFQNGEMLVLRGVNLGDLDAGDFRLANASLTQQVNVSGHISVPASSLLDMAGTAQCYTASGWSVLTNAYNPSSMVYGKDFQIDADVNKADLTAGTTFGWAAPATDLSVGSTAGVWAYPDVVFGASPWSNGQNPTDPAHVFPVQLSTISALTANYDVSFGGDTKGFNVSYDMFFTSKPGGDVSTISNEVMVWIHQGDSEPSGQRIGTYIDGDFAAAIYYNATTHSTAIVANNDVPAGTLDIAAILGKLVDLGILSKDEYLATVSLGAEASSGSGTLTINNLDLDVETANADGSITRNLVTGSGATTSIVHPTSDTDSFDVAAKSAAAAAEVSHIIHGTASNDTLDGGVGGHILYGGAGDDIYVVHSADDQVVELVNEGNDTVRSDVSYVLTDNVENLTLNGAASIDATGNALANVITGNDGDNIIDGAAGADTMRGLGGNDTYMVDNAGDQVIEAVGGGNDTVVASISYALGAGQEIENLRASDPASVAAISLTGNEFANAITGNAGANIIDGGAGADTMQGLGGDDIYFVDNTRDVVLEAVGGGSDTVNTSVSYALGAGQEIEFLKVRDATSTAAINLTGNEFANAITGDAGNNIIDGGAGADRMQGLGGNDTYYVDNALDIVKEAVGGGTDTVLTSVSYTLAAGQEIENLQARDATATTALTLTGNEFANKIIGNAGDNIIDGGAGADVMRGLGGNDTYIVDNAKDAVQEVAGGGTDTVLAKVSYALNAGQEIENLKAFDLNATTALNLTGNEVANNITGNAGNNVIDGGGGADHLTGGLGADTFTFRTPGMGTSDATAATILDFSHAQGDRIDLSALDANILQGGNQHFTLHDSGADHVAGAVWLVENGGTTIVNMDTNGDGTADYVLHVATQNAQPLVANDFIF